jgi:hypothetical protein
MKKLLLPILTLVLLTTSCVDLTIVVPHGRVTTYERYTRAFHSISTAGGIELIVTQENDYQLYVETNENIHRYLVTEVVGGTLRIYPKRGVSFTGSPTIRVYLSCPELESISSSGGGIVEFENGWYGNRLKCNLSGGGEIYGYIDLLEMQLLLSGGSSAYLEGYSDDTWAESSGGGEIDCRDLIIKYCSLDISGGGLAVLNVSNTLDVYASGGSSVFYIGNPDIYQELSGGSVIRRF